MNLKLALRLLLKTPFVTLVAVASLALGIGANAAIFSLVDQLLLRPLPVQEPGRLVNFSAPGPKPGSQSCGQAGDCEDTFSYPMFRDLRRDQTVMTDLAAHVEFGANLSARDQTKSASGEMVSGSYFQVLGLKPALGRLLLPADDEHPGEGRVVVLSHNFWHTFLGDDPGVLNQTLVVNGQSLTIVGVAPAGFIGTTLGSRPDLFVPITMRTILIPGTDDLEGRQNYWAYLFGRLKPGVTLTQASSSLNVQYHAVINNVEAALQQGMSAQTLTKFRAKQLLLSPGARGQSTVSREARTPLLLLFGITALVLLIACANIANLLLARAAARSSEMAVRLSLGAGRGQLVRQLLTESLLLAVIGGAVGIAVARLTLSAMSAALPAEQAAIFSVHLDPAVILFAAASSLVTALFFGLVPALYATRPDLIGAIREQGGQPSGGRGASRWRTALATTQVTLAMALLASAGLFAKSLANVTKLDLGVQVGHVVSFRVAPVLNGYPAARSRQLFAQLEEKLSALPGVSLVSETRVPLLAGSNWGNSVNVEGFPHGPDIDHGSRFTEVGASYFRTVGIPLLSGREFNATDVIGAPRVAIVNQSFAKKFNLGPNPVGRRFDRGNDSLDIEIVGLAKDAKYSQVKDDIPPVFFLPYTQNESVGSISFLVKTSLAPDQLLPTIPKVVASLDPNLPVDDLTTMPDQIKQNLFLERFISLFSATFAGLATLLAAIGLYGVLAYTVTMRTREIGVRMALGAAPGQVRRMILRQVLGMLAVGGTIGVIAAIGIGKFASSMLYRMSGADPFVLVASAAVLALVATCAGLIPAYKASRLDPVKALRYE